MNCTWPYAPLDTASRRTQPELLVVRWPLHCLQWSQQGLLAARGQRKLHVHAHLGTAGCGTLWEPQAVSGPEELRDSGQTYTSTHEYLSTASRGTRRAQLAASGPEELCDSEWSHGCPRDTVTICFQSCATGHR